MCKFIPAFVLGLAVVVAPAPAQYAPDNAVAMVKSWYRHYLHREAEPQGLSNWVNQVRSGRDLDLLLSCFLGSDEYYRRAGNHPGRFVQLVFLDVLGRRPTPGEYHYWRNRLRSETNQEMVYAFLQHYPPRD